MTDVVTHSHFDMAISSTVKLVTRANSRYPARMDNSTTREPTSYLMQPVLGEMLTKDTLVHEGGLLKRLKTTDAQIDFGYYKMGMVKDMSMASRVIVDQNISCALAKMVLSWAPGRNQEPWSRIEGAFTLHWTHLRLNHQQIIEELVANGHASVVNEYRKFIAHLTTELGPEGSNISPEVQSYMDRMLAPAPKLAP